MAIPSISCIVPAWNNAKTIARAVQSALGQTISVLEIVVVLDGSTDDTEAILTQMSGPIRLVRQPNAGVAAARNRGVRECQGDVVAFLDADDVWLPTKSERQLQTMRENPGADVVGTLVQNVPTSDHPAVIEQMKKFGNDPVAGWNGSDVIAKRWVFDRVGVLDAAFPQASFAEWLQRCDDAGIRRHMLREILVERSVRYDSFSMTKRGSQSNYEEYFALAQRRIAGRRRRT